MIEQLQFNCIQPKGIIQPIIRSGVNAALHNSGVMRHSLNANYYANQNRPVLAIREAGAAIYDSITGSRK